MDEMFYSALNDYCNGLLSDTCMRVRLFDAIESAFLSDSIEYKLSLLIDCLKTKIPNINVNPYIRRLSILMLGEAYERLGELDSAYYAYCDMFGLFPGSDETIYAQQRQKFISAVTADTTYGVVYDSLMSEYVEQVLYDLHQPDFTGGQQRRGDYTQADNNSKAILEQNIPNPFANETKISFVLPEKCNAKLTISTSVGVTVAVLVNHTLEKGRHEFIFKTDDIPSGVYFYSLETCGETITKQMQIIK